MSIIKNYLKATPLIKAVTSTYLSPEQFLQLYKAATDEERRILLRHVVRFNTPYVFRDKPLLYEYIRQYLADILQLEVQDVLLIGSAKTGFSMSTDQYGKAFSSKVIWILLLSANLYLTSYVMNIIHGMSFTPTARKSQA